jgi:uncharacterized protein (TIGR03435 family)
LASVIVCLSITGIIAAEPQAAAPPRFEVISVKRCKDDGGGSVQFNQPGDAEARGVSRGSGSPDRLSIECVSVVSLVRMAYLQYVHDPRMPPLSPRLLRQAIPGSPAWISSERYAINAKSATPQSSDTLHGPMLQAILEQRFGLKIHREAKELPVYALSVGKGSAKLHAAQEGGCYIADRGGQPRSPQKPGDSKIPCGTFQPSANGDGTDVFGTTLSQFANLLSTIFDRDVVDRTGIAGLFDIHLDRQEANPMPSLSGETTPMAGGDPGGMDFVIAVQTALQKLGLKVESARGQSEFLVIDHVERPSEN